MESQSSNPSNPAVVTGTQPKGSLGASVDAAPAADDAYQVPEWKPQINIRLGGGRDRSHEVGASSSKKTRTSLLRPDGISLILAAILLFALLMRVVGTDWDQGGLFHPDERDFLGRAERLDFSQLTEPGLFSAESRLNPRWFNYGSLPLYALAGVKALASPFTETDWNVFDLRLPGRNLAALSDTITVLFVFLLASRLANDRRAGLIAALLAALAVIHIQNAHYTAVDAPMTMFIIATIYFSTRLVQDKRPSDAVLSGAMLGFAVATKFTAAPVSVAVGTAYLLLIIGPAIAKGGSGRVDPRDVSLAVRYLMLTVASAVAALLLTQPYMIVDFETYLGNVYRQSEMVRGIVDFPFTRQYSDTTSYLYQMRQLSTWGLGIALGIAVWIGLIWAIARTILKRDLAFVVVFSFLLPYLLVNGQFEVKFLRYMLPATPLLIAFVGCAIWWGYTSLLPRMNRLGRFTAYAVALIAFLSLAHYAIAYVNVFTGPHPAQEVSRWLRENASFGTVVVQEHWEEGIPNIPGFRMHERLGMYDDDTSRKFNEVSRLMSNADYFVLYSNRLAATIPRLPERYPISSRFYEQLFSGELGYEAVYSSVRVPEFLGIVYWDDPYARVPFELPNGYRQPRGSVYNWDWYGWADESFTVYEHPHAIVFENVDNLSQDDFLDVLYQGNPPDDFSRVLSGDIGLTYDDEQAGIQRSGDSWTDIYFLRGRPNEFAWIVWLFAVQLIALAAWPLTYVIFRPFHDRGYLFSKPLGILIIATIAWLLASFNIIGFGTISLAIGVILLASVSLIIFWRLREEMIIFFKSRWKMIAVAETIFLLAFLVFLAIRLANPDLWHAWRGGEKPMDFAYLNAITRSTIMPPFDPWFAGGYLNYYYYGQFLIASLIRITGIIPSVAYNLAVPLIFAFSAATIYTVAFNIAALSMRARGIVRLGMMPTMVGIIAAVLAIVAANIDGLLQVTVGIYESVLRGQEFPRFDYWRSTRIFERDPGGNEITEFPFFTFLYADLHAHMIAIPYAVMALGLSIVAFLRAGMERIARVEMIASLAILGVVVGSLRLINSWDYPTQLLFAAGFILVGEFFYGHRGKLVGMGHAALKIAFVGIIGYLVFLPFHQNFELFNSGVEVSNFKTALWRYLLIHAFFVFAVGSWMVLEWRRGTFRFNDLYKQVIVDNQYPSWTLMLVLGAVGIVWLAVIFTYPQLITVMATLTGAAAVGFTGLMAYLRRHPAQRYIIVISALVVMSLLIAAGVDIITVTNDIGRQNTIFKFYIQAWWLLAIASSFAIWRLWDLGAFATNQISGLKATWVTVFAVLAVGVMVYPIMATDVRLDDRFNMIGPGIDGEAYMDDAVYNTRGVNIEFATDRAAIEWLRNNVDGSPVIVEAHWDLYTWASRISIYTGLPTVLGWDWHQTQQRHDYRWEVQRRRGAINNFYTTRDVDEARDFLDEFDVKYVYVGELERGAYPPSGIRKFETASELNLHPVFQNGPVTIYEYRG